MVSGGCDSGCHMYVFAYLISILCSCSYFLSASQPKINGSRCVKKTE